MVKEFVPYNIALALKELGFKEPCMASYYTKDKEFNVLEFLPTDSWGTDFEPNFIINGEEGYYCSAPLFQQAFRWFREKHGLFCSIKCTNTKRINGDFYGLISKLNEVEYNHFGYESQEEAELECLKKLIELIKKK
jgi:hypothetical protein